MMTERLLINIAKVIGLGAGLLKKEKGQKVRAGGRFGNRDVTTTLREQSFVVLDCETTGFKPEQGDQIISVAAVRVKGGRLEEGNFSTLVDPGRSIPPIVSSLTGITEEMVKGMPSLEEVLPQLINYTGDGIITGFNIGFDLAFINLGLKDLGRATLCPAQSLDVFVLGRLLRPTWPHRLLEDMAYTYNISAKGRHTALGDSIITAKLLQAMIVELEEKGIRNLKDLEDYLCYCSLF